MNDKNANPQLLLIEDDLELAKMMQAFLSDEGFAVEHVANGLDGVEKITSGQPDLVVLDIMLPGIDGLEVCRRVKDQYRNPILMLTAKDDDLAEITALNRGAVGFLNKPVRAHVLLAHINALLRNREQNSGEGSAQEETNHALVHGLQVNNQAFEATLNGLPLELTTAEFELLDYLVQRAGEVVSRDQLYEDLRGIEYDGLDRSVDMRISTLREKMQDDKPPYKFIKTVRGKGYLLAKDN